MPRKFVATFTEIDIMVDMEMPVQGIIHVNDDGQIIEVDIDGVTRADLPDDCEVVAEDNNGQQYTEWATD